MLLGMASSGIVGAAGYLGRGFHLVREPGIRRYVVAPLLVNLAIFGGLGWWAVATFGDWLGEWSVLERYGDVWGLGFVLGLVQVLFTLAVVFALAWVFTLVANLVGAPFNGLLAERVEAHLTGERGTEDPGWLSMIKSTPRLIGSEIAKLLYLAMWLVPLLLLQFVPIVQIVAPFLLFAFGAWMFALEYLDYPMGNHGAVFGDVRAEARSRRGTAFGFGLAVAALAVVPFVNLVLMPIAVAGATALYVDRFRADDPRRRAALARRSAGRPSLSRTPS